MEIANIVVFLESFKVASACNKVLQKRFLKLDSIGLKPDTAVKVIRVRKP